MVKHIILWKLKDNIDADQKNAVRKEIKFSLESLAGKIPGLIDIHVNIDNILASSNADIMLDCTLENEDALKGYAVNPLHVEIADTKVRPYTAVRYCLDFEI